MANLWRNLQFGLRLLWKNPGFSSVAVLALTLGIGGTSAIFSVVYDMLLARLPYPHPEQLVVVWSKINGHKNVVSAGDFLDWKAQNTAFQELSAFTGRNFNLSLSNEPEVVSGVRVPPGFISKVFAVPPSLGRDFLPEEGVLGKDHAVILSHRLWIRRFGADPSLIARQINIDGEPYTVVGILPAGAYDRYPFQLWVPLTFKPEQINHDFHWLVGVGRLNPGVSLAHAQANMDVVTRHIADAYPLSNKSWGATVEPYQNDFVSREMRTAFWVLAGAVGLVLLIANANVANLLLLRGMFRQKEVAIRASLGGSRRQIFGQFLTESLTLAAFGGIAGIGLGWLIVRVLVSSMPPFLLPAEADVQASWPFLAFACTITLVSGVSSGCAPAWQAASMNLNDTLKESGRATAGPGRYRLRRGLVVAEIALALTLLTGAGLLFHTFWNLSHADRGIRQDHVLTFSVPLAPNRFPHPEQLIAFYRQLLEKIEALSGASVACVSTGRPVQGTGFGMPFTIVGRPVADPSLRPGVGFQMVTAGYYQAFGIRLVKGRMFTEQDVWGSLPVAMVNESFVTRFLSGVDPLTQRVSVEQLIPGVTRLGPPIEWQIVGVFHDVRYGGLEDPEEAGRPEIDVPFWQSPWPGANLAIRTAVDPASMIKSVTSAVQSVDYDLPLADVKTMDQVVDENLQAHRVELGLFVSFAGVALLLAVIGVYGVMAFSVGQRTHEIGIRMALGAQHPQVVWLVLKEGLIIAFAGLGLGLGGGFVAQRLMRRLLYGIGAIDLGTFSAAGAVLLVAALLACYISMRRTARVNLLVALRDE